MRPFMTTLGAGVAVAIAGSPLMAANLTLTATPSAAFDPNNGFGVIPVPDLSTLPGSQSVIQFDIEVAISDLQPGEVGLGSLVFDLEAVGGAGMSSAIAWFPNNPQVDTNGPLPGGLVDTFQVATDAGADGTDYVDLVAAIAGGVTAPDFRLDLGQGGPFLLGQAFVDWDGVSQGLVSFANVEFSTVDAQGVIGSPTADGVSGPDVVLGIPEPAGLALMGLGGLAGLARRRQR